MATISVAGMFVGVTAKFNPFSSNDTSASLRGRDDKLITGHLPIWKEVTFIDRDPHWYTRKVKEAIHKDQNAPMAANQHATNSDT